MNADARQLSKLLFEAREAIDMLADMCESRAKVADTYDRDLVRRIDAYRFERGWNPDGYGNE